MSPATFRPNHTHDDHEHDRGLQADLRWLVYSGESAAPRTLRTPKTLTRREVLRGVGVVGGFGLAMLMGRNNRAVAAGSCADVPEETAGPYPGDGTNGPNVLITSGVVRNDLRSSFGSLSGVAPGVPLKISLSLTNSTDCLPAVGYAVYLWHADREGRYSLYSNGVTDQNFLRGVQESDANGKVSFTTIFPGCYDGRWPHMHFEVYPNVAAAADASKRIATSQIAFPKDVCDVVYKSEGYAASIANLAR